MVIGSFGEYIFEAKDGKTFNSLRFSRATRMASHATIEGRPVVESLGTDSAQITLSGVFSHEFTGDLDDAMLELMSLQDGQARALTRGSRCYGMFVVQSIQFSEDAWNGDVLQTVTWTMQLVETRASNG